MQPNAAHLTSANAGRQNFMASSSVFVPVTRNPDFNHVMGHPVTTNGQNRKRKERFTKPQPAQH